MLGAGDGGRAAAGYAVFGRFKIVDDDAEDADVEPDAEQADAEECAEYDSGSSTESEYYEDADYDAALIAEKLKSGVSAYDDSDSSESDDDLFLMQMIAKKKIRDETAALFGSSDSDNSGDDQDSKSDDDSSEEAADEESSEDESDDDEGSSSSDSEVHSANGEESTSISGTATVEVCSVVIEQKQPRNQEDVHMSNQSDAFEATAEESAVGQSVEDRDRSDSDIAKYGASIRREDYDPVEVFGSSVSDENDHEDLECFECDDNDKGLSGVDCDSQSERLQTLSKRESPNTVEICSVVVEQMPQEAQVSDLSETLKVSVEKTDNLHAVVNRERSDSDIALFGGSVPKQDYNPVEVFGSSDSDADDLEDEESKSKSGEDGKAEEIDDAESAQIPAETLNAFQPEHFQALSTSSLTDNDPRAMESCSAVTEQQTPLRLIDKTQEVPAPEDRLLVLHDAVHIQKNKAIKAKEPEHRCKTCPALLPPPMPDMIGHRQCACCEFVYPPSKFDWARHRCKLCSPFVIWKCAGCGHSLPKAAFSKAQRSRKSGSRCKECIQAGRFSTASSGINSNETKTNGYASMSDTELNRRIAELLDETRSLKRKREESGLEALTTTEIETLNTLSSELARRTAEVLARNKQQQRSKIPKRTKVKI